MPTLAQVILSVIALGLVVALNVVPSFNVSTRTQPGMRPAKRWPRPEVRRTRPAITGLVMVLVGELAVVAGNYVLIKRYPSSRGILTTLAGLIIVVGSVVYGLRHARST